ncbi:MAG: PD-(D/E)XK nuclease family protein [Armatimonadota bacterium]
MALTLITGEPGVGKTRYLYDVISRSAADSVPVLLLPSAPDAARARAELVRDAGLPGVAIAQIDTFLATLWEIQGDGRRLVTALQRSALLRTAITSGSLREMTDSYNTSGFLALLERLASIQWGTPTPGGPRDLGRAIAETIEDYHESLLSHGLIELSQATRMLAERVEADWFDGPLLANRFDDLTRPQERFLVQAAATGADVYLSITGTLGSRMTEATHELIGRLEQVADDHVVPLSGRDCANELLHLERALLGAHGGVEPGGDVRLSVAMGEEAEADRIAAEILEAASCGMAFGDVAVIYRDTRRHYAALRRAFDRAGIPADFDVRLRFGETAFGRAVLALLDFGETGARTSLTAFLSSGYAGVRPQDVDELDAIWRRNPVGAEAMVRDLERVGSDARRFVVRATRLAIQGVSATTAGEWKDLAGDLLARAHGREAPVSGDGALLDAQAHRKLCQAVDDIGCVADMGLEQSGIRQVLSEARIAIGGSGAAGKVQVMDVERVRGRTFDLVVIAGLIAGEFPRALDAGVYESEEFRARLSAQGVQIPRDGGLEAERFFFFMALTRARRALVLSRQASDSDGRPLRSSILLEEVLAAYTDADELPKRMLAFHDLGHHSDAPESARRALRSIALCAQDVEPQPVARACARRAARPGVLSDSLVRAELAQRTVFSVTELEYYLACPYRWFYMRYLKPDSLGEDGIQLRRGSMAHRVLAEFYERLSSKGIERVTTGNVDACLALCESILDITLTACMRQDRLQDRLLAHAVRRDVLRLVRRDADFLPGYSPHMIEWSFGSEGDEPHEFDGFSLRGRIDRVDSGAAGLVVIDYKTSKAIRGGRFEVDGVLQAPLYAAVVQGRTGKHVVGTFYRSLSASANCDMSRGIFDPEHVFGSELTSTDAQLSFDEAIVSAVERARRAADGIRSGTIPREPLAAASCAYCGARTWCTEVIT